MNTLINIWILFSTILVLVLCIRHLNIIRRRKLYVTLDQRDSSVTLSPDLARIVIKNVMRQKTDEAKVLVFKTNDEYAFTVNPRDIGENKLLTDLQHNTKYNTVGFQAAAPTVAGMLYDYHMPQWKSNETKPVRLSIETRYNKPGSFRYYIIRRP